MCSQDEESDQYFFSQCLVIKQIRQYIHDEVKPHNTSSALYKHGQINLILDRSIDMRWRKMEIVICFVIWREMCMNIFIDENKLSLTLVKEILLEYKSWFSR
jgi:hypothetical protein